MGTFDSFADAPFQLKTEGEQITITFSPGLPVSGQGTVQWNLPVPAHGCSAGETGAYCGIVVLLREGDPLRIENVPIDGTAYTADPTANANLHTGDEINGALVIGAFYEGEKKSRGEELTTSFVISDLNPNSSYYIAGYAVDCQKRHHGDGVRAYSDEFGSQDEPDYTATQTIQIGTGILPTDGTNLVPGIHYDFDVIVDPTFPTGVGVINTELTIDGSNAGTYEDLLAEINKQLALTENPPQSPFPPNAGQYYWNPIDEQLYQFDGTDHNSIDGVLIEPTDPAAMPSGGYWYNEDTDVMQRWDVPTATSWNAVTTLKYHKDPTSLTCSDFWFDGSQGYQWNGTTWCELITLTGSDDPSDAVTPSCGTFWFNETNNQLVEWNVAESSWNIRSAIFWDNDPLNLPLDTYWFDLETDQLSQWDLAVWNPLTAFIQEEEPLLPAPDSYWFNPVLEELKQWNDTLTVWEDRDVLVWLGDPTDISTCDLWWRSSDDTMFVWDVVNNEWDQVGTFTQSTIDPSLPPVIEVGSVWYYSSQLSRWDGSQWIPELFLEFPTDPNQPLNSLAWLNTETGVWSVWDTPTPGVWNVIDPVESDTDPFSIVTGTYWYNTTLNALNVRNGITWANVLFTTVPLTSTTGSKWFDSSNNILKEWNGTEWATAELIAEAAFDRNGFITFTTSDAGSDVIILVPVPAGSASVGHGIIPSGYADYADGDLNSNFAEYTSQGSTKSYPTRDIEPSAFLWNHVMPVAAIETPRSGADGKRGLPSYDQLGVGDDGSPDERRELMASIRAQLGYPVIEVELTTYQLDTAIQGGLESLRKRSSLAYKRGFFFLNINPHTQRYYLTDRQIGYHKIVTVTSAHRFTSAFLSSAHGAGVYGQIVLQHLYNMGTFDLTSFHLVAQYIEQLEHLFATRLTFHWDESSRALDLFHSFVYPERILIDCMTERTEQELLKDRWCKSWIERYALVEARLMLAEIRGKYASLPGAGGGISLNASELITIATADREELMRQIDDFVVNDVEDIGMGSTFLIG